MIERTVVAEGGLGASVDDKVEVPLAAEFTRATESDPLLPPELLPRPWPGNPARAVVAECWTRLMSRQQPQARAFPRYAEVIREVAEEAGRPAARNGAGRK
ncbi:PaaX family transcriptional regulator C-terminal domain-containing protein [Nocardia amikacinitolerans]|uniref:PaaX family transcriptional regulator C-terminal domain-containing protein n=1 Tax=Nocardia amikacinitolerans TaxID=756689 RepID=UPI0020A50C12|nr:PaaX family transcriptional regulator C-terminal domain-containing protein [Nocardia amikacinitolerans]MCP2288380.1 PaaX-like protein C-terminal domain-containing protein [Nocardia amikacinitolerans]